jgi:hypothetical protein
MICYDIFIRLDKESQLVSAFLLLRMALWAFCLMLGSLGVFFSVISFSVPAASAHAVLLLAAAFAINYFLDS